MTLKRFLLALGLVLAAPVLAFAQGGVTLIQSSVEPLPNCTPAVQGQLEPQIWDITATAVKYCTAPNTWTGSSGGGGSPGTPSGSVQFNDSGSFGGSTLIYSPSPAPFDPMFSVTADETYFDLTSADTNTVFQFGVYQDGTDQQSQLNMVGTDNLSDTGGPFIDLESQNGSLDTVHLITIQAYDGFSMENFSASGHPNSNFNWGGISLPKTDGYQGTFSSGHYGYLWVDSGTGVLSCISDLSANCMAASTLTLQVNGTPNGSQSLLNLVAGTNVTLTDDGMGNVTIAASGGGGSSAFSALTSGTNTAAAMLVGTGASLAPTGSGTITPSAINLAASGNGGVTGLLPNANLAHPATTVNGQTCTLGSTCSAIAVSTIGTPNSSQSALNFITSTVNATGFTVTPSNPTGGNEKFELTGTLAGGSFPALTGDTTTTAGSLVTTTAHVNGNSFPSGVANHQIPVGTATSTFTFKTIPDCNGGSNALSFTQSTNAFSCNTVLPMTTLGDTLYGGASGVATRLAGPTGVNGVPQVLTETPSGGVATALGWFPGGIIPRVVSGGTDTVLATDRANWIWITTGGSVAEALAAAGATGFSSGFVTRIVNAGTGTTTVTSSSTILRNDGTSGMTLAIGTLTECTIDTDNTTWYAVCH